MNKAQKIKGLQEQSAQLHKICTEQRAAIEMLQGQSRELSVAVDSILALVAEKYGEERREDGKLLGYRIAIPAGGFGDALKRFTVKSEKTDGEYVIGVVVK